MKSGRQAEDCPKKKRRMSCDLAAWKELYASLGKEWVEPGTVVWEDEALAVPPTVPPAVPNQSLEVQSSATVQPLEVSPLEAPPLEAQPLEAQPLEAQPLEAQPLNTQPVDAEPIAAPPIDAELFEPPTIAAQTVEEASGEAMFVDEPDAEPRESVSLESSSVQSQKRVSPPREAPATAALKTAPAPRATKKRPLAMPMRRGGVKFTRVSRSGPAAVVPQWTVFTRADRQTPSKQKTAKRALLPK